ncbi:hypothetical protein LTSEADE_2869 [Salmonella enterica subsp. enterica serovar Adelaide str. A4-669]|uniref:Uncharacterized protein n=1 Tax=Salmonella enterica subsp. enterica serovar Adelaide str. A4-669 TaxID=913063 RepID=A0A6C8GLF1_SALET|nr:hypothetical protein LTSEADE_2869 [Salmonella enterica subsp. enterica serovar Adelaide str. A4-669]
MRDEAVKLKDSDNSEARDGEALTGARQEMVKRSPAARAAGEAQRN